MYTAKLHYFTERDDIDFITHCPCPKTVSLQTNDIRKAKRLATQIIPVEKDTILVLYKGTGVDDDEIIISYKQKHWINVSD